MLCGLDDCLWVLYRQNKKKENGNEFFFERLSNVDFPKIFKLNILLISYSIQVR